MLLFEKDEIEFPDVVDGGNIVCMILYEIMMEEYECGMEKTFEENLFKL